MRRAGIVLVMMAALILPARADEAGDIRAVITRQLDAFRHDDAGGAYALATPGIQHQFGDADHFMSMVRNAYPPVYHPQSYGFGALSRDQGLIVQHVNLIGPDGHRATALYTMERQPDGTWRIAGCSLLISPDLST